MNSKEPLPIASLDEAYRQALASGDDAIGEIVVPTELAQVIQQELYKLDREVGDEQ